ncbi:MAG TPA: zinc ribbon domain-containing protein [Thermoplasmata archaeon]
MVFATIPGAFQAEIFSGAVLALCAVIFVIFILVAIWVYRDAESRGMSGVLWLIVVLLFSWIGLIIYLVVRKDKLQPMMAPPYGQQPWQPPPSGGAPPPAGPAPPAQMTCRNCGSPLAPGATFCGKCGAKV